MLITSANILYANDVIWLICKLGSKAKNIYESHQNKYEHYTYNSSGMHFLTGLFLCMPFIEN